MLDNIITLYKTLTGKNIPTNLEAQYQAWGNRAIIEIENKLGWSFSGASNINVLGCSPSGCDCDIDASKLDPAPEKRGEYRAFNFDDKQPYVWTDPFKKVNAVYLCRMEPEGRNIKTKAGDVVILKQITNFSPRYFSADFGKYIKACQEMTMCQQFCEQSCTNCSALLVDAEWMTGENLPSELGYLICDYMDWMAEGGPASRALRSESVDGHSVSYADWEDSEPLTNPSDANILLQYTGPYGMVSRKNIW